MLLGCFRGLGGFNPGTKVQLEGRRGVFGFIFGFALALGFALVVTLWRGGCCGANGDLGARGGGGRLVGDFDRWRRLSG